MRLPNYSLRICLEITNLTFQDDFYKVKALASHDERAFHYEKAFVHYYFLTSI